MCETKSVNQDFLIRCAIVTGTVTAIKDLHVQTVKNSDRITGEAWIADKDVLNSPKRKLLHTSNVLSIVQEMGYVTKLFFATKIFKR